MHGLAARARIYAGRRHIFCTPEQIEDEIVSCLEFAIDVLKTYGFEQYEAELSTWDGGKSGKYDGTPGQWELGEKALARAVERLGLNAPVMKDEAAFYGPKIDMKLLDALGPQVAALDGQFDFTLPKRFRARVHPRGRQEARAAHGSPRSLRIAGAILRILVEHYAGAFPLWLRTGASGGAADYRSSERVRESLFTRSSKPQGFRSHLDSRPEKVNLKIRDAQMQKVPYMLVVGDREAEAGTVAVRHRKHPDQGVKPLDQFIAEATALVDSKTFAE
jgi:threonyl-tRNA synthetase